MISETGSITHSTIASVTEHLALIRGQLEVLDRFSGGAFGRPGGVIGESPKGELPKKVEVKKGDSVIIATKKKVKKAEAKDGTIASGVHAEPPENWVGVTGNSPGTTTIEVTYEDGTTDSFTVTVTR